MPLGFSQLASTPIGASAHSESEVVPIPVPIVTGVKVTPIDAVLTGGVVQHYDAFVEGFDQSQAVTWSATLGAVNDQGDLLPPAALDDDQFGTVIARSVDDPTQSSSANFVVKGTAVVVEPGPIDPEPEPVLVSAPRFARPIRDISNTGWAPSTGTSLFAMLDDPAPGDGDYISAHGTAFCELALGPVLDPGTSSGQVIRYPAHGSGSLTVELRQGTRVIASKFHDILPATPTVHELVLSPAECDSITDYADLRVRLVAA